MTQPQNSDQESNQESNQESYQGNGEGNSEGNSEGHGGKDEKKGMPSYDTYEKVSLEEFARRTQQSSFVTIDTEFMRERSYWSVWCLVQVAAHDEQGNLLACLVDLLDEKTDKALLRTVLYDGSRVKIFHAGKQDWEILWRHFESLPRPVFDSQVAGALLGFGTQCSYERLVRLCLSVHLDKASQYTDWQKRPLSEEKIRYALGDVVYLAHLYPLLCERLEQRGRFSWLEDLQQGFWDKENYEQTGEESFLRLATKSRGQKGWRVLRRLCLWREERAQRLDRPKQWICADVALVELAKLHPTRFEEVQNCRAVGPWGKNRRMVEEVLEQVRLSEGDEEAVLEEPIVAREEERSLLAVLRALQRTCGEEAEVAFELLGKQEELVSFIRGGKAVFLQGWRHEVFGKRAQELLEGKLGLFAEGGKIQTQTR